MPKDDSSASDAQETELDSSSEELETPINGGTQKMSPYERQRMKRIEENRARMEALGLSKMASALIGSAQKRNKNIEPKGKGKMVEEDEEYKPKEGEDGLSSSSEEDDDDEEFVAREKSGPRAKKVKKKHSTPKEKGTVQKVIGNSDYVDDDEALMQAIALSLKDSAEVGCSGSSRSSNVHLTGGVTNEKKGNTQSQEDTGKRKRKKMATSRVQMTEDELILYFFQFDAMGKGAINLRDLRRLAAAHDFTWTDNEMTNMIYCFDSDGDGRLSLDDFRKIVGRCNMIQSSENSR